MDANILVLRRIDEDATPEQEEAMLDVVEDEARTALDYFEFHDPGGKYRVYWGLTSNPYDSSDKWNKQTFKRYKKENPPEHPITHHVMIGGFHRARCGEAELYLHGGKYAKVYNSSPTSPCGPRTICHETYHLFNTRHIGTIRGDSEFGYSSDDCIMGVSGYWRGLAAPTVFNLKFYTDRELLTVTESCEIKLAPIELREYDLQDGEYRFAYLKKDETFISLRKSGVTYPFPQSSKPENIYIHRRGAEDSKKRTWDKRLSRLYLPTLAPGKVFTLPSGTTITHKSYGSEQAVIEVKL